MMKSHSPHCLRVVCKRRRAASLSNSQNSHTVLQDNESRCGTQERVGWCLCGMRVNEVQQKAVESIRALLQISLSSQEESARSTIENQQHLDLSRGSVLDVREMTACPTSSRTEVMQDKRAKSSAFAYSMRANGNVDTSAVHDMTLADDLVSTTREHNSLLQQHCIVTPRSTIFTYLHPFPL